MDPSTVAAIAIAVGAASEIIALIPQLRENSIIEIIITVLTRVFPKK